ncbi:unnamed protein product [Prunus armeniaca]
MKILVKEQILPSLTFSDDKICIECVKGKLTKTKKKGATRGSNPFKDHPHTRFDLPAILREAIKTTNYRVPSNSVPKTPFEIWTTRKPSIRHLHVWGCKAETRIYNPQEKKLDPKMISCHFTGYPTRSKGFKFYCPNYGTRIVETGCAKFIEHEEDATGKEDFIFEEEGDVAVIEHAEQDVTPLIPLSETVLENSQFEKPVEP